MGLIKITFDGSHVTAKQDADINHHVTGLVPAGVIRGLGKELSVTASNNYIVFQDGYVQIYGRRIYVESNSQVYISLDSTKYGYIIIQIELSTNTATLTKVETSSTYPTLTQQNLANGGNVYQMAIAKYSKTSTSFTLDTSFKPTYIETPLSIANSGYERAIDYIYDCRTYYQKIGKSGSGHILQVPLQAEQIDTKNVTFFFAKMSTGQMISFPGNGVNSLSNYGITYSVNGVDHEVIISYSSSGNYLVLTCSNTSHAVRMVYAVR